MTWNANGKRWTGSACEMLTVIADTGPLHYLVLAGCVDVFPILFTAITIPSKVHAELLHPNAPSPVRHWAAHPPSWLVLSAASDAGRDLSTQLDDGERAVIALALSLRADLVLMDDRAGMVVASALGLNVTGMIGILDRAASRGFVEIGPVVARLQATNFRYPPHLLAALLDRYGK